MYIYIQLELHLQRESELYPCRFKNLVLFIVLPANFENPLIYMIAVNSPM